MGGRGNWTYQRDRQTSERLAERDRIASFLSLGVPHRRIKANPLLAHFQF